MKEESKLQKKKKREKEQRPSQACALCGQTAEIHNSHIIPEFLYRELYDEKHRYRLIEADPRKPGSRPLQKGIREYLLCHSCEQQFSRWEAHASGVFRDVLSQLSGRQRPGRLSVQVEFEPFRLFLLSLLWRLNATSDRLRGDMALGEHAEHIRQILLSGTAPEPDQYPCVLVALLLSEDGTFHPEVVLPPSTLFLEGFQVVRVVVSGLLFMYFVPTEIPPQLGHLFLQRDGVLHMDVAPEQVFPSVLDARHELGAGELLRTLQGIVTHLVRSGQADPDAPVTLHLIERDQRAKPP